MNISAVVKKEGEPDKNITILQLDSNRATVVDSKGIMSNVVLAELVITAKDHLPTDVKPKAKAKA